MKDLRRAIRKMRVTPGRRLALARHDPDWTGSVDEKKDAAALLAEGIDRLADLQERLYADNTHAVLLVFQAMDAAGKDSTIKHVMSGVNPQGCQVFSFKAPSAEERDHGYLWRTSKALPERGRIGIHNRSYYEEVLVVRVHPELLAAQQLPKHRKGNGIWKRRYREITAFEQYLVDNGTVVLKFFLNVSKAEQKKRFLERIDRPEKHWKFSSHDIDERGHWDEYMRAYEDALSATSTDAAPWFVVPADHKWFTRVAVASIICEALERLDLRYPALGRAEKARLAAARRTLLAE